MSISAWTPPVPTTATQSVSVDYAYLRFKEIEALMDSIRGELDGTTATNTLELTPAGTAASAITVTQTWTVVGTTYKTVSVVVTDTASAAGSLLYHASVGGTDMFTVSKAGNGYFAGMVGVGVAADAAYSIKVASTALAGVSQAGIYLGPVFSASATTYGAAIVVTPQTAASAFTMVTGYGVVVSDFIVGSGSAITTTYAIYVNNIASGGTNYAIYTNAGLVRFGGAVTAATTLAVTGITTLSTTLTITQGTANTALVTSTGYSLTGSSGVGAISYAGTWNTSGTPTAWSLAITNTASNAASLLINLLAGAGGVTSMFKVSVTGVTTIAGALTVNAACQLGTAAGVDLITIGGTAYGAGVASIRLNGLTDAVGANAGTLTNSPHTGNPAFWAPISIAGTVYCFPCFALT